ncbi:TPA: helix-turn-helix domain-containing protein [Burkholderia vietnamiensis]|uniref:helix-turn-helix domain-containing protein n=2 Tax=Burkholderia vietnamiensis TaxID=60552 RepID=UPI0009C0A9A1|nr:helix-turn-helix domain-containing protein [Burkholderia vietnamiensis]HDR9023459.1 helix-turn-helix domain-containing protein [Burkholderia vietnamiensis]HDR9087603.1 helix-turn-helix domain-containing protein [Burkholderia vietnamiensis]HDR9095711.1 helix-turn-helix domain-containing protein [Burkholderia vietnamiensis]HDR9181720.1 helix-turn-helix domain-containing protein [Burkholderia vietnamiensis]
MLATGMRVTEIAYELGYSDPAHCSRAFRARFARGPGGLRSGGGSAALAVRRGWDRERGNSAKPRASEAMRRGADRGHRRCRERAPVRSESGQEVRDMRHCVCRTVQLDSLGWRFPEPSLAHRWRRQAAVRPDR